MTFQNPDAFWLLLTIPCALAGLAVWGWGTRRDIANTLRLDARRVRRRHWEKYAIGATMALLLAVAVASPAVSRFVPATRGRTGEVALLVDVSASMAARAELEGLSRMERAKPILLEIVDRMELLKDVRMSLHGFTTVARSHTPLIGENDFAYLRESIRRVLNIYSVPGQGSSIGRSLLQVLDKFSEADNAKVAVLVSDGEPFIGLTRGMHDHERAWIEEALAKAMENNVRVVALGVGEPSGAKIPIVDEAGRTTREYATLRGAEYVSYLDEALLAEIATRTGGAYFGEAEVGKMLTYIEEQLSPTASEGVVEQIEQPVYLGHWLFLGAFPLWIVLARRHLLG